LRTAWTYFSLGAIAAVAGTGAAVSNLVAGPIVVAGGYDTAFISLGALAAAGFMLHLIAMPDTAANNNRRRNSGSRGRPRYGPQ
jgi:hypothetical protein